MIRILFFVLLFQFATNLAGQSGPGGKDPLPASQVEEMPRFRPNKNPTAAEAEEDLLLYVARRTNYPEKARKAGITGKVVVQFEISKEGKVVNPMIINSVHPLLDREALKTVRGLPRFSPGRQKGKPVRVKYLLPVNFKLSND